MCDEVAALKMPMSPLRRLLFILLFLTGTSFLLKAQQSENCLKRTVIVNVRDSAGKLVTGLNSSSFRATAEGQPLRISSATIQKGPTRVVVLLDTSGSVNKENHKLDTARLIAGNFLLKGPTEVHPALVVFSNRIVDTLDFSHPPSEIALKLANLEGGRGATALVDALAYAAKLLSPSMPNDAVYLISDGGENSSKAHLRDMKREFLARGIRVFAFRLPQERYFATQEERIGPVLLQDLTSATGGAIIEFDGGASATDRARHRDAFERGYDEMAHFYDLELELPIGLAKQRRWDLGVVDEHGKKRKDVKLVYPVELPACSVDQ